MIVHNTYYVWVYSKQIIPQSTKSCVYDGYYYVCHSYLHDQTKYFSNLLEHESDFFFVTLAFPGTLRTQICPLEIDSNELILNIHFRDTQKHIRHYNVCLKRKIFYCLDRKDIPLLCQTPESLLIWRTHF